jgi:hypothetical protein
VGAAGAAKPHLMAGTT